MNLQEERETDRQTDTHTHTQVCARTHKQINGIRILYFYLQVVDIYASRSFHASLSTQMEAFKGKQMSQVHPTISHCRQILVLHVSQVCTNTILVLIIKLHSGNNTLFTKSIKRTGQINAYHADVHN
jgi:hypothetical protein